jgi:hypothetical protein
MANIGPQMIDSTDANSATTRGHFNKLKPTFGERSFDESNKEQRWAQFFANSAWYGPSLRNKWILLQQQHTALVTLCEFIKEPPENPVKSTPESFRVGESKLDTLIYDALAHLRFLSKTKRAQALPIDNHRRDAFFAHSKDPFSTSILQGTSDKDIGLTNPEFHDLTAAMFGLPSPICKQHLGAQINKANQNKTVDSYGDNVKTAAGVPGGSFMHVH